MVVVVVEAGVDVDERRWDSPHGVGLVATHGVLDHTLDCPGFVGTAVGLDGLQHMVGGRSKFLGDVGPL